MRSPPLLLRLAQSAMLFAAAVALFVLGLDAYGWAAVSFYAFATGGAFLALGNLTR